MIDDPKELNREHAKALAAGPGRCARLRRCPPRRRAPNGFSMLEMLLALAILGASLAILAQLADVGTTAAREARALALARVVCQTKLSELLLNVTAGQTPTPIIGAPVEAFDSQSTLAFTYNVEVNPSPLDGMLAIRVTVDAYGGNEDIIATYSLDRWLIDPALALEELEAEEKAAREEIALMAEEAAAS